LFAAPAHATALLVCSGADGLVVSADSRGHSLKDEVEDYDKLQVVGDRVAVAEAGLLLIRDKKTVRFDVHDWVAHSCDKLPHPSAAGVAGCLARAARQLRSLASLPSVEKAQHPQIILLVAGLDAVERIVVDLRPFAVAASRQSERVVGVGLGPGHLEPDGVLFSLAARRRPDLADPETLAARADFCGLLLAVESELNPLVAPPIRQVLLAPGAPAVRRLFALQAPSPSPSPRR
jgi:hypothetical protein